MQENSKQKTGNSEQRTVPSPTSQPQTAPPVPPPQKGMSSGAKWGIGIGACCCCAVILVILFFILGFAGCSFIRGFGGYNWPATPPLDQGTEIPIPSFSYTPTPSK